MSAGDPFVVEIKQPITQVELVAKQGVSGGQGLQGPPGPVYNGNDLPDFTLIFDNQLV